VVEVVAVAAVQLELVVLVEAATEVIAKEVQRLPIQVAAVVVALMVAGLAVLVSS
jgi:hypothetical protein